MTLTKLVRRNLFRNKVRLVLTVLGTAIALLTFITLHTASRSWTMATKYARKDRLYTRNKITFVIPLPKRYVDDAKNARDAQGQPLLKTVSYVSWFGGRDPNHPQDFFSSQAIDGATYFDVYDELRLSAAEREAFMKDRSGAIVGKALADKFGWKVGDRVTLESQYFPAPEGKPWTFTISGMYGSAISGQEQALLFHWARFDEGLPPDRQGTVGWLASRTNDPEHTAEVSAALDAMFDEKDVQTLTQDERTFTTSWMGMVSSVLDVMAILSIVILAIMGLILANAVGMSTRERSSEYAALKAVGFKPRHIAFLVTLEAALLGLIGGLVGLALAYGIIDCGLRSFFEANLATFFPVFKVDPQTMGIAVAVAVGLGGVAAALPALKASRLSVIDALRRVA